MFLWRFWIGILKVHNKISFAIMEIFLWLKKKPQKGGSAVCIARLGDVAKVIVIFFFWMVGRSSLSICIFLFNKDYVVTPHLL